jgi:hypothetical protein
LLWGLVFLFSATLGGPIKAWIKTEISSPGNMAVVHITPLAVAISRPFQATCSKRPAAKERSHSSGWGTSSIVGSSWGSSLAHR